MGHRGSPAYAGPTTFYEFLQTLKKEGEHGQAFAYRTVNSDVLGWLIRRATGKSVGKVLSERVWRKLGAESDVYMLIDSVGTEFAGGGFNPTLRDMARFGEMMRLDGRFNGQQIVPKLAGRGLIRDPRRWSVALCLELALDGLMTAE